MEFASGMNDMSDMNMTRIWGIQWVPSRWKINNSWMPFSEIPVKSWPESSKMVKYCTVLSLFSCLSSQLFKSYMGGKNSKVKWRQWNNLYLYVCLWVCMCEIYVEMVKWVYWFYSQDNFFASFHVFWSIYRSRLSALHLRTTGARRCQ